MDANRGDPEGHTAEARRGAERQSRNPGYPQGVLGVPPEKLFAVLRRSTFAGSADVVLRSLLGKTLDRSRNHSRYRKMGTFRPQLYLSLERKSPISWPARPSCQSRSATEIDALIVTARDQKTILAMDGVAGAISRTPSPACRPICGVNPGIFRQPLQLEWRLRSAARRPWIRTRRRLLLIQRNLRQIQRPTP